jgi:hypothetical protein
MSSTNTESETFNVFLCHNSADKPAVINIATELSKHGIKIWLDKVAIPPGEEWQEAIEEQIDSVDAAVIFIGNDGIGPWQRMEIRSFLDQYVTRKCRVIPAYLSSVQGVPKIPNLLKNLHFVDFRQPYPNPIEQLLRGIKGEQIKFSTVFGNEINPM